MIRLETKTIKGHKYLYIKDKVKVNHKTTTITFYIGRLTKITQESFIKKLSEFEKIRLKTYRDYKLKKVRCEFLKENNALELEALGYGYQRFKELYPEEYKDYEQAVFVHYAQGTTAIEGNTITPRQAEELFEHKIAPPGKTLREVHELINFEELEKFVESYKGDISEKLIKEMHRIILRNISESSGEYRRIQVYIEKSDYVPPPPFEIPGLMKELIIWYRKNKNRQHPFELAILLHTKFVTIHPYVDGNGRLGRALINFVLRRNGYPTLYLDLGHREKYLDVVNEGNKANYRPIIDFMYEIYLSQHSKIQDEIIKKIREEKVLPYFEGTIKDFSKGL